MKFLILSVLIISLSMLLLPRVISSSIYEANQLLPLVGMILFAFSGIMGIYILYKEKRAGEIIAAAESKDPFWDLAEMKIQARTVFYKVQDAWEKVDPTILEGYTTNEFYEFFRKGLANKERFANAPRLFDITDTRVIGCRDYLNNENDSFVASIEGVPDNETPDIRFSEMYYFVRRDNYWLLDKILHGNGILNILSVSNKEES